MPTARPCGLSDMSNRDHLSHASDARYPTKIDWWLFILLLSASVFFLYIPVSLFSEPVHPLVKIFGSLFFVAMAAVIPWILFGTCYILTKEELIIRCLSRESRIPLCDIVEVFPTRNPLSAPACSLDRLRVKFKGAKFGALISPKDKMAFMYELLSRCPQLRRDNERLILRSST
ncbi:MAG: PH domain-containing protein [Thermodesulfobacteriota bacterium]|nr:PH domain-containing protein [Thermodesulfobacteriota bacterium]